ncbi:hypothetical protein ACIGW4_22950 [Streptomyces sp. NPDC053513]|uniref:effector-associated constant component EACC1 n=1 Tax=unclassified Streptomyces TaxID=2593676 RepID=UPI0037CF7DB3
MILAGGLVDVLLAAFGSSLSFVTLVAAIVSWRRARTPATRITIQKGDSRITLDAKDIDPAILESLMQEIEKSGGSGDDATSRDDSPGPT